MPWSITEHITPPSPIAQLERFSFRGILRHGRVGLVLICLCASVLTGCKKSKQDARLDDDRNPYYQEAQVSLSNGNLNQAVQDYQTALTLNPKLAKAHYALGQIYGDRLNDPVSAIYHFKRFMELNPPPDKAAEVNALIDRLSLSFAASLANSPVQNAQIYAELQSQNTDFRKMLEDQARTIGELRAQVLQLQSTPASNGVAVPQSPTTPTSPAVGQAAEAPLPPAPANPNQPASTGTTAASTPSRNARSYKVVSGDSLWKIAHKMYPGDTRNGVEKIKAANKETLADDRSLKIGQVLVIP